MVQELAPARRQKRRSFVLKIDPRNRRPNKAQKEGTIKIWDSILQKELGPYPPQDDCSDIPF